MLQANKWPKNATIWTFIGMYSDFVWSILGKRERNTCHRTHHLRPKTFFPINYLDIFFKWISHLLFFIPNVHIYSSFQNMLKWITSSSPFCWVRTKHTHFVLLRENIEFRLLQFDFTPMQVNQVSVWIKLSSILNPHVIGKIQNNPRKGIGTEKNAKSQFNETKTCVFEWKNLQRNTMPSKMSIMV